MNFKQWLISEEEEKDINLSNPKLTTTIPPLNTSLSNPKLAKNNTQLNANATNPSLTTIIPPLNKGQEKDKKPSSENFKELAYYFGRNGSGPSAYDSNKEIKSLARWINYKQSKINPNEAADKETWDNIVKFSKTWDKEKFPYELPLVWRDVKSNKKQETNSENFKELAYYFGRNGSGPSAYDSNKEIKSLARWINYKQSKINPNEATDKKTWDNIVKFSKTWDKEKFPYELPLVWRDVKSNKKQDLYQKYKKNSSENFKELAYYFGRNGSEPSQDDSNEEIKSLAIWLKNKKSKINPNEAADKETWDNIVKFSKTWDKEKFPYELPLVWRDVKSNKKQEISSENLENLAYYFGRNNAGPSANHSNSDISYLGRWHAKKKNETTNTYEASDGKTWAELVARSKTSGWIDPDTGEPFKYSPLPYNWRDIEPSGTKSRGEEYVLNILKKLEIKNDPQHRDTACFNKRCLPFDFSITHNRKKYLLEYNGKQHYVPAYFGSGEEKTDQEIANDALEKFKYTQENDAIKYNHCEKGKIPFLVIPYWLDKNSDIIKNIIKQFLKTNEFNETFAKPNVPPEYKAYHDRILKITECFASGKLDCKELFKKQKTTFEQFLINKNFINK